MDTDEEVPDVRAVADSELLIGASTQFATRGLNPAAAILVAFWYSLTAAGAMSSGFAFLHRHSESDYFLVQNLMWTVGIGIGIGFAVCLARNSQLMVGSVSSVLMSALLLSLLFLGVGDAASEVSLFGFQPSFTQFLAGLAVLTLLSGLLGAVVGRKIQEDESLADPVLGIRGRHWFWLWLAVYAWVSILPTGIYYLWLEIISSGYVLIHPSLWFDEAWTEGWTLTFGFAGFAALIYGIKISILNVSAGSSSEVRTRKRVFQFLLGTLILAGPVANILFRIAISSLERLPNGITVNPWWILR